MTRYRSGPNNINVNITRSRTLAKSVGKLIAQGKDVTPKQVSNALQAARSKVYSKVKAITGHHPDASVNGQTLRHVGLASIRKKRDEYVVIIIKRLADQVGKEIADVMKTTATVTFFGDTSVDWSWICRIEARLKIDAEREMPRDKIRAWHIARIHLGLPEKRTYYAYSKIAERYKYAHITVEFLESL